MGAFIKSCLTPAGLDELWALSNKAGTSPEMSREGTGDGAKVDCAADDRRGHTPLIKSCLSPSGSPATFAIVFVAMFLLFSGNSGRG